MLNREQEMEDLDFSRLDVALAIYDANDDPCEAELLCGVALRKDDLEVSLRDPCELAERKYGDMRFARLLDEDEEDEAMRSACLRWKSDSMGRVIEEAERCLDEGGRREGR